MVVSFKELKNQEVPDKKIYAVVGHPISHSLSPLMHQTALEHYRISATYLAIDLPEQDLQEFIPYCNHENFLGCNITIPYKEVFNEVVDLIDPFADQVGVVNTLVKKEHKLIGYNTDVYGFLEPLKPYLYEKEFFRAIIFGTGGSSKAVKIAFESEGFEEIIFVSRKPDQRKAYKNDDYIQVVDYNQWQAFADETDIFVNCTPVGMYPNEDETIIRNDEAELFEGKICYDLIYNPLNTKFLKMANQVGAKTINGLEMLIHQGSKSFELWTGKPFPIEKIRKKLITHLRNKK